jgi:hypothetical protein
MTLVLDLRSAAAAGLLNKSCRSPWMMSRFYDISKGNDEKVWSCCPMRALMSSSLCRCLLVLNKALLFYWICGVIRTAGVPLVDEEGSICSPPSTVAASFVTRCKNWREMMRSSKESPMFTSGQSSSLWTRIYSGHFLVYQQILASGW